MAWAEPIASPNHILQAQPRSIRTSPRGRHPTFRCKLSTPHVRLSDRILLGVSILWLYIQTTTFPLYTTLPILSLKQKENVTPRIRVHAFHTHTYKPMLLEHCCALLSFPLIAPFSFCSFMQTKHNSCMADAIGHKNGIHIFRSIHFSFYRYNTHHKPTQI